MRPGVFSRILRAYEQASEFDLLTKETTMIAQTCVKTNSILDLFALPPARPDAYFYDYEAELAAEVMDSLPEDTQNQPLPEISSDDFEKLFGWFLS
jgi:hypothetical protein